MEPSAIHNSGHRRGVLFTAFEPSGDDHAAAVIAELRRRHPDLPIYAWGGPKMEEAGATIIERTGQAAVMGLPGPAKVLEHLRINREVARWLTKGLASVHVPVDSPAANFPLCKRAKAAGLTVVHLVAPQVWAWGSWRIRKLRRCTDHVLCLLPFEEDWFRSRGVPATFVGHPLFDELPDDGELSRRAALLSAPPPQAPSGPAGPRVALMPGSRPAEMRACFPVLLDAVVRLQKDFPGTAALVAATHEGVRPLLDELALKAGGWPKRVEIVYGDTDAVVRWCDFALVVSGTVTLQIARQLKPMVAFYRPNRVMYNLLVRWLLSTEMFTLPNLIAGKRIIPELIPHFGDGEELAVEVIKLMRRTGYADDQREGLARVVRRFEGKKAAVQAVDILEQVGGFASSIKSVLVLAEGAGSAANATMGAGRV